MFTFTGRLCAVLFATLLLSAPIAHAQNSGDGTVYSRFGLGELDVYASPQVEALGGRGVAVHTLNYVNFLNPASYSDQLLTRLSAGARFQALTAQSEAAEDSELYSGSLQGVQFSLPLLTQRLGLAFGLVPFSRANYLARREDADVMPGDTLRYAVNYEGRGGLQQILGGAGYRFNDNVSVGANVHFVFGIIEDALRTRFEDPAVAETDLTTASRLYGVTATLGAQFTRTALLGGEDQLDLGVAFTLPTSLSGEQVRTVTGLDRNTRDTLTVNGDEQIDISADVPWSARAGLSYQPDARWMIVLDGEYEPWSGFERDFPAGSNARLDVIYHDRYRLSGGVEFLPAGTDLIAPFFERTAYRIGGYYDRGYVSPVDGITLNTAALTAGLSLPTLVSGTRIDLNVEAGIRGTTEQRLVRDRFYRVSLHLNIGERWFRKRRFR